MADSKSLFILKKKGYEAVHALLTWRCSGTALITSVCRCFKELLATYTDPTEASLTGCSLLFLADYALRLDDQ